LPDLLEIGTTTAALRRDVEAVLGERGQWLAAQETRWAWAAPLPARDEDRERLWETGERGQRRRLFELLRREQPAQARELLEEVWKDEEPEDRAWFLDALADGLALDDEAMLERGLGDTRREVRSVAARLLSRLPESAFGLRMRARALPLVRLEGGIRKRLRVALPEEFDEGMAHDGIARKPPRGIGERAWWLLQVVAATPLSAWAEIGLSPDQAASLRANDEFEQPLRKGLARAAEAQADPAWAAPFLEVEPRLADFVHPDVAARVALERLAQGEKDIAERLRAPWPRTPSEQALKLLVKLVRRGGDWQRPRLLAERLDPSLADELAEQLGDLEPGSASASHAQEILTTLSFRRDMHEELR
jgi:Family of unknown function (DUF5691)